MKYKDLYDIEIRDLSKNEKTSGLTRAINNLEKMGISNVGQLLDYAHEKGIVETYRFETYYDYDGEYYNERKITEIDFKVQGFGKISSIELVKAIKNINGGIVIGKPSQENEKLMQQYDESLLRKQFLNIDLKSLDMPYVRIQKNTSTKVKTYYDTSKTEIKTLGDLLYALADSDVSKQIPNGHKEKLFNLGFTNIEEGMTKEEIDNIYVSSAIIDLANAIIVRETARKQARYSAEARKRKEEINAALNSVDDIKNENEELKKEYTRQQDKITELKSLLKEKEELMSRIKEQEDEIRKLCGDLGYEKRRMYY